MQYIEVNNKDHNYSEVKLDNLQHSANITQNVCDDDAKVTKSCRSGLTLNKETFGQIKDINELKKITPRVKLLTHDANSLNELTKISLHNKVSAQKRISILEQTKQELKKYCRTCAGLKLPLVDIFSEKGNQMRLSQQIKHLEEISPYDSLSTQMCMDCICDLKMSYKFFMQIKKAEVKLKSILITLTDATTRSTEANKLQPIESSEKHRGNNMECNATNLSLNKENNERACVPKISAIFSLKNEQEFLKVEKADSTEESENKTDHEIFENIVQQNSDDNESIEEFDPDDPPFQPDSSDAADSDDEIKAPIFIRQHIIMIHF
ncbi:hypothetical protein ANTRET_LOCUS2138 [Anthophora retusa]